ncbi:MAG TPA: ATP-binding protein [Rubrobacter sp.]|jgi:predicted AAA+ superfamily ATPase|nr:ATP-binding protein [Rubrobacter sp.]
MERAETKALLIRARGIATFRGVLDSAVARDLLGLLELLEESPDAGAVARIFGRLWEGLALEEERLLPDAWQSHLVGRVLDDENPFSLGAEKGEADSSVLGQARRDLRTLGEMFAMDAAELLGRVESVVPALAGIWVPWRSPEPVEESPRRTIARKLSAAEDWGACAELLAGHFARHGAGPYGRHRAFLWREGRLLAVSRPDPVSLSDLITYEREREPLIRNTERFLAGLPAHHALLYGLPGTGKSSTVKAIMNEYADLGLRLVEVKKEDLAELPGVLEVLGGRGRRFVLFVDDLSFEEHEVEYKALKALLEGSVEEPPENVRLYATSNRRNLIRETFSERDDGTTGDDVHARDTMQEKLSLAARFGLRLTFPSPDQARYLKIVSGLARERGLAIPAEDLRERALLWDRWHAGRSGRTARQFVDELEAEEQS